MSNHKSNELGFSIIIINWNGARFLKKFLPEVLKSDYSNFEVILADNNSDDESVQWTKKKHPQVKVLEFDDNYGYAKGNNLAAKHAEKEILIFLNNDAVPQSDWLTQISHLFQRYPKTAVIQPKMLNYQKPTFFDYAGAAGGYLDKLGYPWCKGRIFDTIEEDSGQYDDYPYPIFWASGAAFCIRKEIFETCGGFDGYFEFHMEEIDLCWRVKSTGYEIRYCPEAKVYHVGGGSLPSESPRKVYYNFRNSLIMLTKNYRAGKLPFVLITRFFLDGLAALKFALGGNIGSWFAVSRAYFDFYQKLPYWLNRRGENKNIDNHNADEFLSPASIVVSYYLLGNKKFSKAINFSLEALSFFTFTRADRNR